MANDQAWKLGTKNDAITVPTKSKKQRVLVAESLEQSIATQNKETSRDYPVLLSSSLQGMNRKRLKPKRNSHIVMHTKDVDPNAEPQSTHQIKRHSTVDSTCNEFETSKSQQNESEMLAQFPDRTSISQPNPRNCTQHDLALERVCTDGVIYNIKPKDSPNPLIYWSPDRKKLTISFGDNNLQDIEYYGNKAEKPEYLAYEDNPPKLYSNMEEDRKVEDGGRNRYAFFVGVLSSHIIQDLENSISPENNNSSDVMNMLVKQKKENTSLPLKRRNKNKPIQF